MAPTFGMAHFTHDTNHRQELRVHDDLAVGVLRQPIDDLSFGGHGLCAGENLTRLADPVERISGILSLLPADTVGFGAVSTAIFGLVWFDSIACFLDGVELVSAFAAAGGCVAGSSSGVLEISDADLAVDVVARSH